LAVQTLDDGLRADVPLADRGEQRVEVLVVHRLGNRDELWRVRKLLNRQVLLAQRLHELVAAGLDGLDATFTREPLADLVLGLRRLDELQPVAAGARTLDLRGEDLDRVTTVERGVERHQTTVDARTDTAVTDIGVDRVRKVDRRGADRK